MVASFYLYFTAVAFDLSRLQPCAYYPSSRSRSLFYKSVVRRSRMPTPGDSTEPNVAGTSNPGDSPVINEVFSMFKGYLEVKLDEKSKLLSRNSKITRSSLSIMPRSIQFLIG